MRVLVTGSATPLGASLVRTLAGWGDDVVGLDRRASATTHVVAALADRAAVARALRDVDAVVDVSGFAARDERSRAAALTDAEVDGTRVLLEAAAAARVQAYVRTSRLGRPAAGARGTPARWIDEDTPVLPDDACAAAHAAIENYCEHFARHHGLPCVVLKIAGLLEPEAGRVPAPGAASRRIEELLHRRVDLEDAVSAHVLAVHAAPEARTGRYLVAATTPFTRDDLAALAVDAPSVVARRVTDYTEIYLRRGWRPTSTIDHVLDNARARRELGWRPRYDFGTVLARLARGEQPGSQPWPGGVLDDGQRLPGEAAA